MVTVTQKHPGSRPFETIITTTTTTTTTTGVAGSSSRYDADRSEPLWFDHKRIT